jgi:hypothetical protein
MVLLINACRSSTPVPKSAPNHTPYLTLEASSSTQFSAPAPTAYSKPANTPSPTSTPYLTPVRSPAPIEPEVIRICPDNRFVALGDLGLPREMRLVMLPANIELHGGLDAGFSLMSPLDAEPQAVNQVAPDGGSLNHDYQVSPDGRWVSFLRQNIDEDSLELWVSSIDGQQLWSEKQIVKDSYSLWLTEQEIFIIRAENNHENLILDDPFTLEEMQLSPLPEIETDWYTYYHFRKDGNIYTLYVDARPEGYTCFLFDHNSNSNWKVFPWLDPMQYPDTSIWLLGDSTFMTTVERPYGFDFASNLDLEIIREDLSYGEIMRQTRLLDKLLPLDVWRVTSDAEIAILVEKDINIDLSAPIAEYILDLENMVLKDFFVTQLAGEWNILSISPDGQFAEMGYEKFGGDDKGTGILDLETGYIALIDSYQLLGWGFMDEATR